MRTAAALLLLLSAALAAQQPAAAAVLPRWRRALAGAAQVQPLGMRDAEASKQLRVLAFGDSLTEGWIQIARVKHPYTWNLEKRLRDKLAPRGVAVTVTNAGVGGKGVLDDLNGAWYSALGAARASGQRYQYIVFMAGINDVLRQRRQARPVFERMKEMWAAAAQDGATIVVIPTLPTKYTEAEPVRKKLAGLIRAYVLQRNRKGDRSLVLLDLERNFSDVHDPKIFEDGIHFTDYGYQQLLSGLIYDALARAMKL